MEVTKRTYQKHKTEKKITVKHYLSKSYFDDNEIENYTVYVQVTYNRKNTKFRSKIPYSLVEIPSSIPIFNDYKSYEECYMANFENNVEQDFRKSFENALIRETNFINWLIDYQIKMRPDEFVISEISEIYHRKDHQLTNFIESSLKREIQATLSEIMYPDDISGFSSYFNYPTYCNTSALNNLEFYISEIPQLASLKEKYSSRIWFLDIYLEQPEYSRGEKFNPIFSMQDPYDFTIISFVPTIYDYLTNTFQRSFYSIFEDKQLAKDIIHDMDTLFEKYGSYSPYYPIPINSNSNFF